MKIDYQLCSEEVKGQEPLLVLNNIEYHSLNGHIIAISHNLKKARHMHCKSIDNVIKTGQYALIELRGSMCQAFLRDYPG